MRFGQRASTSLRANALRTILVEPDPHEGGFAPMSSQIQEKSVNTLELIDAESLTTGLITIRAERGTSRGISVSHDLVDILADDSQAAFRRFLDIAVHLSNAGSAGLSLLRLNELGQALIRWHAVSGALTRHEGSESPRDCSPCGLYLEAATITILSDPERTFPFLKGTAPWISEYLMVPLCDDTRIPMGTLWLAHHDGASHFGDADTQVARQLAMLLERVVGLFEKEKCRQMPLALLESFEVERRTTARDLAAERSRRADAEAAQRSMRQALVFKDAEILDAHHRVKNTMQIASSYLQLQSGKSPFAHARAALQEAHCRLHLLADVHELFYKGNDAARKIPMLSLLQTLTETLKASFPEKSTQVTLHAAIEPIMLTIEAAIPLASLVNEAMTNAYKHAFPGRSGEIRLTLQRPNEGMMILQVSDNGIGLPSGNDKPRLGLELIRGFAAQLGGALVFAQPPEGSGTTLTLTIPAAAVQTPTV
jgi:two-component sensor histidine kinase